MANRETTLHAIEVCIAKLLVGGAAAAGLKLVERGRSVPVPYELQPCMVMIDGDDGAASEVKIRGKNNRAVGAALDDVEFTLWGQWEGPDSQVGPALNALEDATIQLLATDTALGVALGPDVELVKAETVKDFRATENGSLGWFGTTFRIGYILNPTNTASA